MIDEKEGMGTKDSAGEDRSSEVSPWEWVAAAVGLIIVLSAIGFLSVQAVRGKADPPQITVQVESILPTRGGFLVQFTTRNSGTTTVAGLHISGELGNPASPLETSETVIDFVPGGGERRGGLYFTLDPRVYPLRLRPLGYDLP